MASLINIVPSHDIFFRYKMPEAELFIEHKQNGRTLLLNLNDISKALDRPNDMIIKYFQYELSIPIIKKDNKIIFPGIFEKSQINKIIQKFIREIVICGSCNNPETTINYKKMQLNCKACGNFTKIKTNEKLFK